MYLYGTYRAEELGDLPTCGVFSVSDKPEDDGGEPVGHSCLTGVTRYVTLDHQETVREVE
ncbi:hypothetical protein T265_12234 [Opisthorchis viverrini]|uniref:Uncharacterized protein n=1 Tax=Opisthorchis viverrini TaxID=6198 RepID=A0A074ZTG5_OPIVI|nr:hypothetical protein T265_12234 [Opisthorchis viverrini]KER18544.1 hypothetical protein T265_12234 [Opisthorchis viverrini]